MGPRFCKRGNRLSFRAGHATRQLQWGHAFVSVETFAERCSPCLIKALQWGHAFVSVETLGGAGDFADDALTSMGPRFCKRGNCVVAALNQHRRLTSMGPRFCKRGNRTLKHLQMPVSVLQWGHAFVSVETASRTVGQVYHLSSPLRPEAMRQAHILAG